MPDIVLYSVVAVVALAGLSWFALSRRSSGADLSGTSSELLPPLGDSAGSSEDSQPASVLGRLSEGLARTKGRLVRGMDDLFYGRKTIDEQLWQQLEELLITSDVGPKTTMRLMEALRSDAERDELDSPERLRDLLAGRAGALLEASVGSLPPMPESGPLVIMVVGVNGAGKTTTIGKLAARYTAAGHKVLLAAGDTFRAAAIEQIQVWGRRSGAEVVKHEEGSDPAAVAHDGVSAGIARGADVVICDTAGRLHSKAGLMGELTKVERVIGNVLPGAPHETLLVLDATNGQNAIAQAREFSAVVGVTGIVLTKLDGTARGGVILGIADELDVPVKLIGIGEAVEDLRDFDPGAFVAALFATSEDVGSGLGRGANSAQAAAGDIPLEEAPEDDRSSP